MKSEVVYIDGREVEIEGERNILEMARKVGIDIPTFCYHSELSVYGACRLCLVEVEGRGIVASCSTAPQNGMVVHTSTDQIREIRKIAVELLLANHDMRCPTCTKSKTCALQAIARRLDIKEPRFRDISKKKPIDTTSPSIVRNPNRCILCGDCVRTCKEIQGIGVLEFAHRGADVEVLPAFGKGLNTVECVFCGQCVKSCPTGALTIKSDIQHVWDAIADPKKKVVVQFAPAVRTAIGDEFGITAGEPVTGQLAAALRLLGFDRVFDTSFGADFTVIEEGTEFIHRLESGKNLPQFTSCCPAWVKYAEQFAPDMIPNLSTCKSPHEMFGALAKEILPKELGVAPEDLVVVSIMPCTAKKFEAARDELSAGDNSDVDYVITTQELARMIEERGIRFRDLPPESLDMPMGFKTGAGVIFGTTGGVTEAVLRFAADKVSGKSLESIEYKELRGDTAIKETSVTLNGKMIYIAVVQGLAAAKEVIRRIRAKEVHYDIVEVMACPGGCVNGGGQPDIRDTSIRFKRAEGLYRSDKMLPLHKSQDNPYLKEYYDKVIGEPCGECAHELFHTHFHARKRITDEDIELMTGAGDKVNDMIQVNICLGTACYMRGAQTLLQQLVEKVEQEGLADRVDVKASFCMEQCDKGPSVSINGIHYERCTVDKVFAKIKELLTVKA